MSVETFTGYIEGDLELKTFPSGSILCSFELDPDDGTEFIPVKVWGDQAWEGYWKDFNGEEEFHAKVVGKP